MRILFAGVAAMAGTVLCVLAYRAVSGPETFRAKPLQVYSGAGLLHPMEEICRAFEKETGVDVQVLYGGTGVLMARLNALGTCDVFIPGDARYVEDAARNGWVDPHSRVDVVFHVPVLAVSAESAGKVACLEDLAGPDVRVGLGDPDACAIGRTADSILERKGIADEVRANVCVRTPTVNQLLVYLAMNQIDAAILWEDLAGLPEAAGKVRSIPIPAAENSIKTIAASRGARSVQPEPADAFIHFLTLPCARNVWLKWGFTPYEE